MNHNQFPQPEQPSELTSEMQAYLDMQADKSLIVVRGAGTEDRRLEDGWKLTGKIEYFEKSDGHGDIPYVTVSNDAGDTKRVRLDALMHFNPVESDDTSAELNHEMVVEQLGTEAVDAIVEPIEMKEDSKEHLSALKEGFNFDVHTMRNIVQQGDINYFAQYTHSFSQRVDELHLVAPNSGSLQHIDNIRQKIKSLLATDMSSNSFTKHAYSDALDELEVAAHSL